ncbi:hypothetical protein FisN_13Lu014 [Fistulifera solaris]|uniref:H(+)-exporting diphosphatase n=1 Tax=Fistulifera solaris TaxID=1519565 RepID=A0A1Z5JF45_FISSO|nr:hypothetical protein FisN_13Lu014 [Fistulifera solaris]|eukprot:GAX12556.1 hypothetical protein FisN_13Lu014 [Fistulifera solaris]
MTQYPSEREKTDALDAAGNTTAAIGKGFAIGSAALVSLALFGAFVTRIRHASGDEVFADGVNMLEPVTFAFLIVGGLDSLNIVMKLQAVLALVFADTFFAVNAGKGLLKMG